jgi:hypothetical protein
MAYASTLSPRPPGGQLNGFRHSAHSQPGVSGFALTLAMDVHSWLPFTWPDFILSFWYF